MRGLVGKLSNELVGLDVDVLLPWHSFGGFNIAGKELFGRLGPSLLDFLGVVSLFICLKQLVGVGASRDHHGCVCRSTEDSLVKHYVLGLVVTPSIW